LPVTANARNAAGPYIGQRRRQCGDVYLHATELATVPLPMSATEFGAYMAGETDKWAKVIRAANIKPD
jgi:hypothetical protein